MQSKYERTDLIITEFDVEDIISTSGETGIPVDHDCPIDN